MAAEYIIGIDLGTSNCAVAFAPLASGAPGTIDDFPIVQMQRPGQVAAQPLLPSCLYLPALGEIAPGSAQLPWDNSTAAIIGEFARWQGARVPGRLVASAKSWLCHPGVDRTAPILPWAAPTDVPKLSPMRASALLLSHLSAAWHSAHPSAPFREQEVVVTVPASFDEVARALTVSAARAAGLENFTLVEEPQAAFYDFTSRHRHDLADALAGVRLALVVDVGGGTTDFTLIAVRVGDEGPVLERIAVGEHLILGGDNMDGALARRAEERITSQGRRLDALQWAQLVQAARAAKENLLAVTGPDQQPIAIAGAGSRLIGATLSTEVTRDEAQQLVVEGFFPACEPDAEPRRSQRSALQELGLPYAHDPAITRHLAAFLRAHAPAGFAALGMPSSSRPAAAVPRPDAILLNGGVFNAPRLAQRLLEVASSWWPDQPRIPLLEHDSLDLAVARGAAAYGLARRGVGRRIGGGAAQALYVGIAAPDSAAARAVCVIPRGQEEARLLDLAEQTFQLLVDRPVQFPLFSTTADRVDRPGEVVEITEAFRPLPPLHTVLRAADAPRGAVPVHLRSALSELGTLELWCISNLTGERWRLEFDLRGAAVRAGATVTESMPAGFDQVRELVDRVFGAAPRTVEAREVKRFGDTLEAALGPRDSWRVPLLRELWSTLFAGAKRRRRSAVHERLFYRYAGFGLRPGFGYPLDEWRCEQTFSLLTESVNYHHEVSVWNEFWIMWRRIAGGLTAEHHQAIWRVLEPHLARRVPPGAAKHAGRAKGVEPEGFDEMVRTVAALERLDPAHKVRFGHWIAARLRAPGQSGSGPWAWALGRLGARAPLFGSAHQTVPSARAAEWLALLLDLDLRAVDGGAFAAVQLARLTGDRARDLDQELRDRALAALRAAKAPDRWLRLLTEVAVLEVEDEARALGDTLPLGLKL